MRRMVWTKPGEITRLREERSWKLSDLVERSRIDPKTLRAMDKGDRQISETVVRTVALAFRVTTGCLLRPLKTEPDQIAFDSKRLSLRAWEADEIYEAVKESGDIRWKLTETPEIEVIADLREFEKFVEGTKIRADSTDGKLSTQLEALADRHEMRKWIERLNEHGISVLVGKYLFWEANIDRCVLYDYFVNEYFSIRVLMICLSSMNRTSIELDIDPGHTPPDYAPPGKVYFRDGIEIPNRRPWEEEDDDLEIPF